KAAREFNPHQRIPEFPNSREVGPVQRTIYPAEYSRIDRITLASKRVDTVPSRIPIIGPREAKLLFRYFVSVDRCLAGRFALGYEPDEEHLTSLLTELLDQKGAELHPLQYSLLQLNHDLKSVESLLQVELSLTTNKYNRHQEARHTQSDLGVVLDYRDHIQNDFSFHKAALFQAKRLYRNSDGKYGLSSVYEAYNDVQHSGLKALDEFDDFPHREIEMRRHHGQRCFYLLYNPSMIGFESRDQEQIRHRQLRNDATSIFDYTQGLHLYHELLGDSSVQSFADIASLVCPIDDLELGSEDETQPAKPSFEHVLANRNLRQSSLPWFLVFGFMLGDAGSTDHDFLQLVWTGGSPKWQETANIQFLPPRYVLNIRVHGGLDPEHCNDTKTG
ncbi:MAG: hypothetical protein GXY83_12470, partial [Rhodopirellula sp.]|nr:hypothetical protein [Rhodopirellula sp.]